MENAEGTKTRPPWGGYQNTPSAASNRQDLEQQNKVTPPDSCRRGRLKKRQLFTTVWQVPTIQWQTILSFIQPSPIVAPNMYLNSCALDLEQVNFHRQNITRATTGEWYPVEDGWFFGFVRPGTGENPISDAPKPLTDNASSVQWSWSNWAQRQLLHPPTPLVSKKAQNV